MPIGNTDLCAVMGSHMNMTSDRECSLGRLTEFVSRSGNNCTYTWKESAANDQLDSIKNLGWVYARDGMGR
jgi:hypothetical protein